MMNKRDPRNMMAYKDGGMVKKTKKAKSKKAMPKGYKKGGMVKKGKSCK